MALDLSPSELRVLGALIEKSVTTPDNYPLSLNSLTAACNQTSNRAPIVHYDEATVSEAVESLRHRALVLQVKRSDSRVTKYQHVADRELELDAAELAAMCVLMLRGAQTVGEIRARSARLFDFADLAATEEVLERLASRPFRLVTRLPRQPGQKDVRYVQLLAAATANTVDEVTGQGAGDPQQARGQRPEVSGESGRLAELEASVEALRGDVEELKTRLEEFRKQFE